MQVYDALLKLRYPDDWNISVCIVDISSTLIDFIFEHKFTNTQLQHYTRANYLSIALDELKGTPPILAKILSQQVDHISVYNLNVKIWVYACGQFEKGELV